MWTAWMISVGVGMVKFYRRVGWKWAGAIALGAASVGIVMSETSC
jgi:hypothetical protein